MNRGAIATARYIDASRNLSNCSKLLNSKFTLLKNSQIAAVFTQSN